ncbi:hypothetical protein DSO57_1033583 [Entomophthora muscae]|nr:hypothetical protein DSO57_1033583 [Entomophthora muscae]
MVKISDTPTKVKASRPPLASPASPQLSLSKLTQEDLDATSNTESMGEIIEMELSSKLLHRATINKKSVLAKSSIESKSQGSNEATYTPKRPENRAASLPSKPPRRKRPKQIIFISSDSDDSVEAETYEVEILLGKKGTKSSIEYLVKWKGYNMAYCSWEPVKNLDCRVLIEAFEECLCGLNTKLMGQYDPAIESIISSLSIADRETLVCLPKNISDFLLLVNKDVGPSISVVNTIDADGPPENYEYIAKSLRGEGVPPIDSAFLAGCECKGSCHTSRNSDCSCLDPDYQMMPYDKDGLLQLPPKHAIHECNVNCSCPLTCRNRVIQRGRTVKLQIFKTANKGWGVRAMEKIPKGRFVAEYVGEIITSEEAERRGLEYDSQGRTYLFDLDYKYGHNEDCPYSIDAYKYGNVTHFINHSCDPNIAVYTTFYESVDYDIHSLAFFAIRDVRKYEELCFDYSGDTSSESAAASSQITDQGSSGKFTKCPCYCGAQNCRKFVHIA